MAWEWVTNKARKAVELDAEYKSHSSLIDRLCELPEDASYPEIERTWSTLDDRARAGFKMTLGALILKQQAIRTPAGRARLEKLVGLRNGIDRAVGATTATDATPQTKSRSQLIGATRDRITPLVDRAGAIPRGEMITALRRELDDVLAWIEEHAHRDLTLRDVAAYAAVSVRTLSRRFQAETGQTPMQWVTGVRIRHAQQLLETTSQGVERIGRQVGFTSAANFREQFRRLTGVAPQSYRNTFRDRVAS